MEAFCGGDTFWNTSITWGDDATYPDFTECFQNSVLIWISSGWLLITLPIYLPYLLTSPTNKLPNSWKVLLKLCLAVLQLIIIIIELSYGANDLSQKDETFFQAYFIGPLIEGLSIVLVMLYIELERRKGFITSGILFMYWVLANITYIIPFYRKIIQKEYESFLQGFVVFNVYYALSLAQLVLSCIAEVTPEVEGKKPSPETRASFLSRISFSWINGMVVTGYRRPLTEADMFTLNPRDQSKTVVQRFQAKWRQQEIKCRKKARIKENLYITAEGRLPVSVGECELSESTPLLRPQRRRSHDKSKDAKIKVSLFTVVFKTFGWELLRSNFWKLVYDLLVFVNPFLLKFLIDFAGDTTKPTWKGYVFACGFLVVIVIQSFSFHALMHQMTTLGVRVRAALIDAIFRKSLTMNNQARTESTVGEIVNLMSVDCQHIMEITAYLWGVWSSPLQMVLSITFLFFTVGYATLAGIGVMVILTPVNMWIMGKVQKLQVGQMAQKDQRIKLMTEILNGMKILKLYAWEMAFGDKVTEIRQRELALRQKSAMVEAFLTFSWTVAPFTVGLACFATYIFIQKDHLIDAETAFVAISLFNILRFALNIAPIVIMESVKAQVSMKRIGKFLNHDDLDFSSVTKQPSEYAVKIENGTFLWDQDIGACLKDINIAIRKGSLVAVVGTVGAGKSSLMSAMLGEMDKIQGAVNVDGSTAYVPQQAWIQNATLRDNVLFGNVMNGSQYEAVLGACSLHSDLEILPAQDLTEIGEKGINLSGGQRQRVSLARAVYNNSDIYLLDDPLSAVDSHVGKHIFKEVIGREGLLRHKTRILVTHGIQWLPSVDTIIVINNGIVSEVGSYDELLAHDGAFAKFLREYFIHPDDSEDEDEEDEEVKTMKAQMLQRLVSIQSDSGASDSETAQMIQRVRSRHSESDKGHGKKLSRSISKADKSGELKRQASRMSEKEKEKPADESAKLIEEEELEQGNVRWSVIFTYMKAVGLKFTFLIFLLYGSYQGFSVWASVWLTNWTSDPDLQNLTKFPADSQDRRNKNDHYLEIYGVLGIAQAVMVMAYSTITILRLVAAARTLHHNLLINVLRGPMAFFDTTPIGRIVNRFSQDIESIDSYIPHQLEGFLDCLFVVISTMVVIAYSTPIFVAAIMPLGILYFLIQRFYIPASRQLKRLESKTRSPIYNNFSESLTGANIIRAFNVQERFILESQSRVDHNQTYAFSNFTVNRWLGFRLEVLGATVVLAAAVFAVLERDNITGSLVGLSISYALQITDNLNWLVRMTSELETAIVSVERVGQYTANPTEAPLRTDHRPALSWPDKGLVELRDFAVRYRKGLDLVLKNINITIQPGEKVGIVGRTGAGKSSLTISLFRIVEAAKGRIIIDGEDVSHLGLYDLRSRLTILPQEPVLFSGTLRMNLDPMDEHTDDELWMALEHAHLKTFVEGLSARLQYECGEGGQNLSVGQRQLMCLARSLLRKSKILVLDEATAAVDLETDKLIQDTIAKEFADCTILTIAHRLNTVIDYDRILVLSQGEVVEFDSPQTLLQNTSSVFYSMAKDAGIV